MPVLNEFQEHKNPPGTDPEEPCPPNTYCHNGASWKKLKGQLTSWGISKKTWKHVPTSIILYQRCQDHLQNGIKTVVTQGSAWPGWLIYRVYNNRNRLCSSIFARWWNACMTYDNDQKNSALNSLTSITRYRWSSFESARVSRSSSKLQCISGNDCCQFLSVQPGSLIKSLHVQTVAETVPRQSKKVLWSERKKNESMQQECTAKGGWKEMLLILFCHFNVDSRLSHL